MMNQHEVLRIVDSICRDKAIDKEMVYADLEAAMVSATRKAYGQAEEVDVKIDRLSGQIHATCDGAPVEMSELGRIAAQTFKQVMIQRIREAERGSIFEEYSDKVGTIVTGTVARFESGALVVNLGRAEGFLPRSEQIPGETHHPADRIRAMVLDVEERPHQVRIVLTRTHPDYIRRLFELEVPEVGERIIEIRALAREAGYRTKIAVSSIDSKVDAVGACVGVRGSRIRNIVDELGGEKIDIVRWNESSQILIGNALKPAEVQEIALCFELNRATVVVAEDQLSLAIGKRGQNVRLAARLTGWDIDIVTPVEYNKGLDDMEKALKTIEGVEDVMLDKMMAMGVISPADLDEIGPEPLVKELGVSQELAEQITAVAREEAKRLAAEAAAAKAEAAKAEAAKAAQEAEQAAASAGAPSSEGFEGEGESVAVPSDTADPQGTGIPPMDTALLGASWKAGDALSADTAAVDEAMMPAPSATDQPVETEKPGVTSLANETPPPSDSESGPEPADGSQSGRTA
jgi:N utilization substance protein A